MEEPGALVTEVARKAHALRGVALGRRNWTFAGCDKGGRRAAAVLSLITTCKLIDVDPRARLADALANPHDHPAQRIDEPTPWNWKAQVSAAAQALITAGA